MNVKPGDLAVIVKSQNTENIGLFVEVVEPFRNGMYGPWHLIGDPPAWVCKAKGQIVFTNILGERLVVSEGAIPDECLHPIRPGAPDAKINTEKELEVTA